MFRLIRIGFSLACLAAFFWFATQVKLGELTLYQHIREIGASAPSQKLIEGTKQKVSEGVFDVGRLVGEKTQEKAEAAPQNEVRQKRSASGKPEGKPGALAAGDEKPADAVTDADRKALRKLLESRP